MSIAIFKVGDQKDSFEAKLHFYKSIFIGGIIHGF
ncbi:hypothetical protein DESME_10115 [Desulfitobacterium metallireducens DSM 15288]|uniref:Uncharacterized protein n=1 Tax=Desulfitobacterium metallireducens DSM 15288 TaxID=871968 RepID=W0EGH8_9FIRM|nr:hypothetical protein DESME_10115 [Desulfitobacterium metallireducens DSM 15288]